MKDRKTVFLGECVRCSGDLCRNRDFYGEYMQCLQCGYVIDVEDDGNWRDFSSGHLAKEAA